MENSCYKDIVYKIIGCAMTVHQELRWALAEQIYQEALCMELHDNGIDCLREVEVKCYYKGRPLKKMYKMDILVGDVVVEVKSVSALLPEHRAQLCNYLRLTHKSIGLLINFCETNLKGERWVYDKVNNECFLVDRHMKPLNNYSLSLLNSNT